MRKSLLPVVGSLSIQLTKIRSSSNKENTINPKRPGLGVTLASLPEHTAHDRLSTLAPWRRRLPSNNVKKNEQKKVVDDVNMSSVNHKAILH
jgi:hypothetical protein